MIDHEIKELKRKLKFKTRDSKSKQLTLKGDVKEEGYKLTKKEIREIKDEIKRLVRIKEVLYDPEKKPFIWEIDFAEIFGAKGGFDIVIGNPPYLSYKKISPPTILKKNVTNEKQKEYKNKLKLAISDKFDKLGIQVSIHGFSDYYVYFYFYTLTLLNQDGVHSFVTSNFWLDTDYGVHLQKFLCKNVPIIGVFDCFNRTFKAKINTVITFLRSPVNSLNSLHSPIKSEYDDGLNNTVKFVLLKDSFEKSINASNLIEIENMDTKDLDLIEKKEYRVFIIKQDLLKKDNQFIGKWSGKFFKAPRLFFDKIFNNKKMKKLGSISELKTGLKESGYKDYLKPREEIRDLNKNYYPILKDVKKYTRLKILQNDSFIIKNVSKFKESTENKHSRILWPAMRDKRHFCLYNPHEFTFTGNFFGIEPPQELEKELLFLLNSTLTFFFFEIFARTGFGDGSAIMVKSDLEKYMMTLNPSLLDKEEVKSILKQIMKREIKTIFEECGIKPDRNIRDQIPNPLSDRAKLDKIIFDELDLTEEERREIYWTVCELVKQRIEKAKSLRR